MAHTPSCVNFKPNRSQVFGLAQSCVVFAAVAVGLGKKPHLLSTREQENIEKVSKQRTKELHLDVTDPIKFVFVSDLLYIVTIWLSRLSVTLVFLRLSSNRGQARRMRYFVLVVTGISVVSLLVVAVRQDALSPWKDGLATTTLYRWIAVGAIGAFVEAVLVAAAIQLVWGIQMANKSKFTVVSGFAIRILVLVPLVIRLISFRNHVDSQQISNAFTMPEIWTQVEMHLCLVGATVPCLRIFLKSFNTGYFGTTMENIDPTGTMMATKGDSYNLSTMKSGDQKYALGDPTQRQVSKAGMTTSRVTHEQREDGDSADDRSDRRIYVRQTVNVAYDH